MMRSLVVESAPSLAIARRRYTPGCEKWAVVAAWLSVTGMGPAWSNVTFPGPPYCIQVTLKRFGGALSARSTCAPNAGVAARGERAARGLGRPSSTTVADKPTGAETVAF